MVSARSKDTWNECLNTSLKQEDAEIYDLIQKEKTRQFSGLELIASEVRILTTLSSSYIAVL